MIRHANAATVALRSRTARALLRQIARHPATSTKALAASLGLDAKAAAYHVHCLRRAGLVVLREDDGDGGGRILCPTPEAEAFLAEFLRS